jgi:hypothetical protein
LSTKEHTSQKRICAVTISVAPSFSCNKENPHLLIAMYVALIEKSSQFHATPLLLLFTKTSSFPNKSHTTSLTLEASSTSFGKSQEESQYSCKHKIPRVVALNTISTCINLTKKFH